MTTSTPVAATAPARSLAVRALDDTTDLPDARQGDDGAVFSTGKVRALRPAASGAPATKTATSSTTTPVGAQRPPVLASEILREDLEPHEPGVIAARYAAIVGGVLTVLLGLWAVDSAGPGVVVEAFGIALAVVGVLPLRYGLRATMLAMLAATVLVGSAVARILTQGDPEAALAVPVTVLAAGLMFRSWHRASLLARVVVAGGILLCALWLGGTTAGATFPTDAGVRDWLPLLLRWALVPVLLAAMLAFMAETTTGGCAAWAGLALGWYVLVGLTETVLASWPAGTAAPSWSDLQATATAMRLLGLVVAPTLAIATAQLLVVAGYRDADADAERPT